MGPEGVWLCVSVTTWLGGTEYVAVWVAEGARDLRRGEPCVTGVTHRGMGT